MQRTPVGRGVMHVVGGQDRQAVGSCQRVETFDASDVVTMIEPGGGDVAHGGQRPGQMGENTGKRRGEGASGNRRWQIAFRPIPVLLLGYIIPVPAPWKRDHIVLYRHGKFARQIVGREQDQLHALGMIRQHRQRDVAGSLVLPFAVQSGHAARADQACEAAIGSTVFRIGEEGKAFDRLDTRSDDRANLERRRLGMHPHHARHRIGIGDPQRIVAQRPRAQHQVHRIRRAA